MIHASFFKGLIKSCWTGYAAHATHHESVDSFWFSLNYIAYYHITCDSNFVLSIFGHINPLFHLIIFYYQRGNNQSKILGYRRKYGKERFNQRKTRDRKSVE